MYLNESIVMKFMYFLWMWIRPKKKNCYVALTRPKFKNWVGRSGFFFFFFFTYRERVEFLNGENSGGMQSKRIWVRILNDVQLAIFRPWALLLHLVRTQLLRNHFFWCRRKEYNQGFQETYTLYTFTRFCTSHGPPNAKKWQKVMFLHFFIFLEPSCKFSSSITDII